MISEKSATIEMLMLRAGVTKADPEWGLQYNLTHASLDPELGIRNGLCEAIKKEILLMREKGMTVK